MRRSMLVGVVVGVLLTGATGGFAAQRYLISSARQVKPGAIAYRDLSRRTRRLIARTGERGPRGFPGPANALAQASGLVAWTSDPALISRSVANSSGSIHGGSVWLNRGDTIRWMAEVVAVGGSGLTHGEFAIYDSHLHLLAKTADRPSSFQTGSTPRWVALRLTSPYTVTASGVYYFADLIAGAKRPRIGVVERASPLVIRNVLPSGVARAIRGGPGFSQFPGVLRNTGTDETRSIVAG